MAKSSKSSKPNRRCDSTKPDQARLIPVYHSAVFFLSGRRYRPAQTRPPSPDLLKVRGATVGRAAILGHAVATRELCAAAFMGAPAWRGPACAVGPRGPVDRRGSTVTVCRLAAPTATVTGRHRSHGHRDSAARNSNSELEPAIFRPRPEIISIILTTKVCAT